MRAESHMQFTDHIIVCKHHWVSIIIVIIGIPGLWLSPCINHLYSLLSFIMHSWLASYPGLLHMCFKKSGKPGRSGDVIGRSLRRSCISTPTHPRSRQGLGLTMWLTAWASGQRYTTASNCITRSTRPSGFFSHMLKNMDTRLLLMVTTRGKLHSFPHVCSTFAGVPLSRPPSTPAALWGRGLSVCHNTSCLTRRSQKVAEVTSSAPCSWREVRSPALGVPLPGEETNPTKCVCGWCQHHVGGADGRSLECLPTGKCKLSIACKAADSLQS